MTQGITLIINQSLRFIMQMRCTTKRYDIYTKLKQIYNIAEKAFCSKDIVVTDMKI